MARAKATASKAKPKAKAAPARKPPKAKATAAKAAPAGKAKKTAAPAKPDLPMVPIRKGRARSLVIVESPAKAKTIKKYLGSAYLVKASVGHIKDLPKSKFGVDIANGFEPEYVVQRTKEKALAEIKDAARKVEDVFLAPDPDREGEAIAWHLAEELKSEVSGKIHRVLFNEITKKAITEAIQHPVVLNIQKFEAQQARRILDRIVGYQISPILWNKVKRGLSAGRVQSVAVRLVCEREAEVKAFIPEEYWSIEAMLEGPVPPPFAAKVIKVAGDKLDISEGGAARALADDLRQSQLVVERVEKKERRKFPQPPFITSKLQQDAARKLRFTAKKTMALAQRLYEGLELGEEGPVGLITYMRTDSVRLSDDAVAGVRAHIGERYGADFLPEAPVLYKVSKQAQGAHEAIRPTTLTYDPETVRRLLQGSKLAQEDPRDLADPLALYTLIWNRFVACQMKPAVFDATTVDIAATAPSGRTATLRASGQVIKFAGFTQVYVESAEEDPARGKPTTDASGAAVEAEPDNDDRLLPPLEQGDVIKLVELTPEQHFTQPPPRFTEASLVKELEEKGIGRPSTFASILSTIQDRGYVEKRENRFFPSELGVLVNGLLVTSFPEIVDVDFTANMELGLDRVEEGSVDWHKLLAEFYGPFKKDLDKAALEMRDVKREEIPTDFTCQKCGSPMIIKFGKNGSFLACKGYPECKNTMEFLRKADGTIEPVPAKTTTEKCDLCGAEMLFKRGRFGEFLACSRYPDCTGTKPVSLGVTCIRPGCGGFLTERRSRRNKPFFGCSNWSKTKCDWVLWDRPIPEPCPRCATPFVVIKESSRGKSKKCVTEGCGWAEGDDNEPELSLATPIAALAPAKTDTKQVPF